eukprot:1995476-Pyramimonas_sp.AAC.1
MLLDFRNEDVQCDVAIEKDCATVVNPLAGLCSVLGSCTWSCRASVLALVARLGRVRIRYIRRFYEKVADFLDHAAIRMFGHSTPMTFGFQH